VRDEFKSHITETTKLMVKKANTQFAVIPVGLTSQVQPVNISINKPFKAFMSEEWT
jgi:hypothetical protein